MNLSQLYYFRKLAELEHYGKASEELFITQPSLSNSIGNLEKELGVPLFERVGRNVRALLPMVRNSTSTCALRSARSIKRSIL